MKHLPEAEIVINGKRLSNAQSRAMRYALQIARRDLNSARTMAPNFFDQMLDRVEGIMVLIDETEVTL